MGNSWGHKKSIRSLPADVKPGTSSSDAEEITRNRKQIDLPQFVVGKILENLKFKDLLQCSLVNKFWMHEARRLLREKHECAFIVYLDEPVVSDFIEMETTLASADWSLPYESLSITQKRKYVSLNPKQCNVWWTLEEFELVESAIKNIILRAGPFPTVHLDVACDLNVSVHSWIVRKLLAQVQKTVEVMIIKNLHSRNVFEDAKRFPELKKFEVYIGATIFDPDVRRIQNFLQSSEKLESVGRMSGEWLQLLEEIPPVLKLALVKEFTCADMYVDQRRSAEFAGLEPKLEKIYVPRQPSDSFTRKEKTISMSLLLSSQASLIELQVTYEVLEEIRREKPFALFENVRRLSVDVPRYMAHVNLDVKPKACRRILQALVKPTIIALFPKLEELEVKLALY